MTDTILTHSYYSDFYAKHGYQFFKKVAQDSAFRSLIANGLYKYYNKNIKKH